MSYSKGISWITDTRIPFVDDGLKEHIEKYGNGYGGNGTSIFNAEKNTKIYGDTKGRFTPNLLVCDDMLNDGSIIETTNSRYYNLDLWFNKMVDGL